MSKSPLHALLGSLIACFFLSFGFLSPITNCGTLRLAVVRLLAGSVLVEVAIAPDARDAGAASPAALAAALAAQATTPNSALASKLATLGAVDPAFVPPQANGPPAYLCPDGSWQSTLLCATCAAGSYLNGAACAMCAPGTFTAAASSAASCSPCAAGAYASAAGATACTACSAGTAGITVGASSPNVCALCAPGAFSSAPGAAACSPCGVAQFAASSGATACAACVLGSVAAGGATQCTVCAHVSTTSAAASAYVAAGDGASCVLSDVDAPSTSSSSSLVIIIGASGGALLLVAVLVACVWPTCPCYTKCRQLSHKVCGCCARSATAKQLDSLHSAPLELQATPWTVQNAPVVRADAATTRPASNSNNVRGTAAAAASTGAWQALIDPSTNQTYYYNQSTGATSWEAPVAQRAVEHTAPTLATPAWQTLRDPSTGQPYYCNSQTGESSWELPPQDAHMPVVLSAVLPAQGNMPAVVPKPSKLNANAYQKFGRM